MDELTDNSTTVKFARRRRIAVGLVLVVVGITITIRSRSREADTPVDTKSVANPAADRSDGDAVDNSDEAFGARAQARGSAQLGDYETALVQTDQAIQLDPENVESYLLRAEILFKLHRSDEMIGPLTRAIELDPQAFDARANLAYALRYAGRLDEAEREARQCLSLQPDFVYARRILAEIHRDRGDLVAARDEIQQALQAAPRDLDSRLLEADLLIYDRDFEQAYTSLEPLLSEHPLNHRLLAALARAAQMTGRTEEATRFRAELSQLKANLP